MQRRLQSCSPSTVAKKMGPSLSLRDTPSCCLLGFSRVAPAEESQSQWRSRPHVAVTSGSINVHDLYGLCGPAGAAGTRPFVMIMMT